MMAHGGTRGARLLLSPLNRLVLRTTGGKYPRKARHPKGGHACLLSRGYEERRRAARGRRIKTMKIKTSIKAGIGSPRDVHTGLAGN